MVKIVIKNNSTVLFQGDSVTDVGRIRDQHYDLGNGYPMMAANWFWAAHPEMEVTFLNRGNSGDRTTDLVKRWQKDCLDLKPDIVSILIGINDCWRHYDSNNPTTAEEFYENYRDVLMQTKENTEAEIILIEPFLLPYPEDRIVWREDLDPKINVVRDLAREFKTFLIPMDGIFHKVSTKKAIEFWTPDGVHPSKAGHALIAKEWLQIFE